MKKIAIASASLALAAMPVVGVFAASEGSFTDTITVDVAGGCTIGQTTSGHAPADRTFSASIVNGTDEVLNGVEGGSAAPALNVQCNTATETNFNITAVASNSGSLKSGDNTIPSGNTFSGDTSAFAYSIDSGSTWNPVPTTSTVVKTGSATSSTPVSFSPTYRVYVALGQAGGAYSGTVQYTLAIGS